MKNITFRRASNADAETVCGLWMKLMAEHEAMETRFVLSDDAHVRWKNDFPLWIDDQTRRIVVAEQDGRLIGFVQAHRRLEPPIFRASPEVYIDEIYVLTSMRDNGIGKKMLVHIKQWAEELGVERIRLKVLAANEKGIGFWEREGAAPIDLAYTIELESAHQQEKKVRAGKLGF